MWMLRNIDVSREILANSEMGLLSSFLNSFKKLLGMLAGTNAFLAFIELIIDDHLSISIDSLFPFIKNIFLTEWKIMKVNI